MRPEGWDKARMDNARFEYYKDVFEAGADAYEEGLKKQGKRIEPGDELSLMWHRESVIATKANQEGHIYSGNLKGWLVLIEE